MHTILKGKGREVVIGLDKPFVVIGEKINPTGSKKLAAALKEGNFDFVVALAKRQIAWGADALDVNVGVPEIDEAATVSKLTELLAASVDVPLCIDSNSPQVLEAGLKAAPGKPLVNSVNAEERSLNGILPIVKERGAAVIGLTFAEGGIPKTPEERVALAGKIIERAAQIGIPIEDVIIDPLVMTVGSDSKAAQVTIQTIEALQREFGVNIILGASNVSFGLPDRHTVNQAFLAMAIQAGATCSITDPIKLGQTIRAADLLLGRDDFAMRHIKYFRAAEKLREQEAAAA
ncbi:MAG: dihydropteroate synthase [Anaerolineales bacterium]|nr:MAG: dihydropteroate synthase [Anaerolineales bacterium]WKZ52979.1 MAG: dihydropteroate synthase [Anaerolineales bacterium]